MIIKPFYSLIDHREFEYLKEKIKKANGTWTIDSLSCITDYFYNLNAIKITEYLFSWNDVPGNDSYRLIDYLVKGLGIGWAEDVTIKKKDNKIIVTKDKNSLELELNEKENKVILKASTGETHEYISKKENGKLNIYTDDSNDESECYLTEWGVGYIVGENDNIMEKFLKTIVKGIKTPDEYLHNDFKKWLDKKDEDTELETSLHGISFPLLRMDDINGEYEINFDDRYLFSWDDVPGKDSGQLLKFLKDNIKIEWVENAKIKKSDDDKVITITKTNNSLTIKFNKEESKVILEISSGETQEYISKKENGKLNIYLQTLRKIEYSYRITNKKKTWETWEVSITNNNIPINNNHKDILKKLCIQHHLYTTLKSATLHHSENTERSWSNIKFYVDVRTAQYRKGISILRGMLNEFSLFNELFTKVWNMDVPDEPQIKEFTREGDNGLKLTKNFDLEKVHTELYQHANIVSNVRAEIDDFVTDSINLRLTDDTRSAQLALRILQPLFVIGVVLSFMTIVFKVIGIDIFEIVTPKIFVVGAPIMAMKIIIITLAMVVSMFWITLNIITYVRAFEQTIGTSRSRFDITRDLFFYIGSIGMIFIVVGLLIVGLESPQLINTLAIVIISIIVMLFLVLLILTIKENSASDGVKDNRKNIILEWACIGASMFLSVLSVGFLRSVEAVGALPSAYISLLWFILFMVWLFFLTYAQKMGNFIFVVNETKPWDEFKNRIRGKFANKINNYIKSIDNDDPYKEWDYGKIFIKFEDDFLKNYIQRDVSLMLVYSVILMQILAVTFNIGFIMDKDNLSLLFISAVASILTTIIKLDQHIKVKVEEEGDGGRIYSSTAFIASIIADIHFMPAVIFYSADFSLPLAVGAFIANIVALAAILIESLTIKNKVKKIEFKI